MPQRPKARANQIKSAPNKIAPPQPSPSIQKTPSRAAISQHPPVQMAASAKSSLADQVRREWKLFEEWLAELRQEANQAKSKALQELRQSLEVSKKSYPKGYHNALMNQFEVKKREILDEMGESPEFFHMVRTEWDERLERAGLKVEYWDPMTPEEQRVVQIALGGDTEEEEYYPSRGPPEMQNPALHLASTHLHTFVGTHEHPQFARLTAEAIRTQNLSPLPGMAEYQHPRAPSRLGPTPPRTPGRTGTLLQVTPEQRPGPTVGSSADYVGPVLGFGEGYFLDDNNKSLSQDDDFARYKLQMREQMIRDFHREAADMEIALIRTQQGQKLAPAYIGALEAEVQVKMMELRRRKDEQRKEVVAKEEKSRKEQLRQHVLAQKNTAANQRIPGAWPGGGANIATYQSAQVRAPVWGQPNSDSKRAGEPFTSKASPVWGQTNSTRYPDPSSSASAPTGGPPQSISNPNPTPTPEWGQPTSKQYQGPPAPPAEEPPQPINKAEKKKGKKKGGKQQSEQEKEAPIKRPANPKKVTVEEVEDEEAPVVTQAESAGQPLLQQTSEQAPVKNVNAFDQSWRFERPTGEPTKTKKEQEQEPVDIPFDLSPEIAHLLNSTSGSHNAGNLSGNSGPHRPQVQTQGPRYNVTVTARTPSGSSSGEDPYGNLMWTPTRGDSDEDEEDEEGAAAFGAALASVPLYAPRWSGYNGGEWARGGRTAVGKSLYK